MALVGNVLMRGCIQSSTTSHSDSVGCWHQRLMSWRRIEWQAPRRIRQTLSDRHRISIRVRNRRSCLREDSSLVCPAIQLFYGVNIIIFCGIICADPVHFVQPVWTRIIIYNTKVRHIVIYFSQQITVNHGSQVHSLWLGGCVCVLLFALLKAVCLLSSTKAIINILQTNFVWVETARSIILLFIWLYRSMAELAAR